MCFKKTFFVDEIRKGEYIGVRDIAGSDITEEIIIFIFTITDSKYGIKHEIIIDPLRSRTL